jgi:hypothetical protein
MEDLKMTEKEAVSNESDEISRGEDGRPMLDFPSMKDLGSKSTENRTLPPDVKPEQVKDTTADSEAFCYNPDSTQSQMNEHYAMGKLNALWGSATDDNIKVARWVLGTYADDGIVADLERTGLGSHPDMVEAIYNAAIRLDKEAAAMDGRSHSQITGKDMLSISMKKLGEKAKERLNHAINDAQASIIEKHGGISML